MGSLLKISNRLLDLNTCWGFNSCKHGGCFIMAKYQRPRGKRNRVELHFFQVSNKRQHWIWNHDIQRGMRVWVLCGTLGPFSSLILCGGSFCGNELLKVKASFARSRNMAVGDLNGIHLDGVALPSRFFLGMGRGNIAGMPRIIHWQNALWKLRGRNGKKSSQQLLSKTIPSQSYTSALWTLSPDHTRPREGLTICMGVCSVGGQAYCMQSCWCSVIQLM